MAVVERESHLISIYTVLVIGYTKMMKKKVFFSERTNRAGGLYEYFRLVS